MIFYHIKVMITYSNLHRNTNIKNWTMVITNEYSQVEKPIQELYLE